MPLLNVTVALCEYPYPRITGTRHDYVLERRCISCGRSRNECTVPFIQVGHGEPVPYVCQACYLAVRPSRYIVRRHAGAWRVMHRMLCAPGKYSLKRADGWDHADKAVALASAKEKQAELTAWEVAQNIKF